MTAVVDKPRSAKAPRPAEPFWPQVNLLPPEVAAARGLRAVKRWLLLGLVGVLVVCAAAYGFALTVKSTADTDLLTARNETVALQTEVGQYAEVPRVQGLLASGELAKTQALADEVLWSNYVGAIAVTLPGDTRLESFTASGRTPMADLAVSSDALAHGGVGRIVMIARTPVIPDAAAWVDALDALPGLADTKVNTATIAENDGTVFYRTTVTVEVTSDALAQRFDDETGS